MGIFIFKSVIQVCSELHYMINRGSYYHFNIFYNFFNKMIIHQFTTPNFIQMWLELWVLVEKK